MLKPYHKAELTFDIVKEIGQDGQNSRTFLSFDHQLNAEIVSKQIVKAKLNSADEFFSESKALYASAHPNVVQIHYACFDQEHVYVAMPYYRSGSVKDKMKAQFLTIREVIVLAAQVLAGMHNIHSKNLIHFDIKPDNILISDSGEALLSDFGQAKQMNYAGIAAQNRHYVKMISPEATLANAFDRTFDIYQFGLTLYRMCNGNESFYRQLAIYGEGQNFDRAKFANDLREGKFPDRSSFLPHVHSTLRNVIKRCLSVEPGQRYQSAIEVANALAPIDGKGLDWRYHAHPGKKVWTKNEDGINYELSVADDGSSMCYRSSNGGPRRRVLDACKAKITDRDLRKLFSDY